MRPGSAVLDAAGAAAGLAAAAFVFLAPAVATPALPLAAAAFAVVWIVRRDAATFTIPDGAVLALAALGVAWRLAAEGVSLDAGLALGADVALTGGVLWLLREGYFRLRGHDGIGFGDVKLAAAAGCLIGATGFAFALLAASLIGIAVALVRGVGRTEKIAFGVLLAPAVWLVLAAGALVPGLGG